VSGDMTVTSARLGPTPWSSEAGRRPVSRAQAIRAILQRDVADRCTVELPSLPMVRYPLPQGTSSAVELWRDWLKDGWQYRGCDKPAAGSARSTSAPASAR
jgi:hypothetical protein